MTTPARRPLPRRPLPRWVALVVRLLVLALMLVLAGGWWAGREGSLATTLDFATRWLPADQTLQVQDVRGSLAEGGRLGRLRWQGKGWQAEAQGVTLIWSPLALLDGELRLPELDVAQLRLSDQRPPHPDTPATPPTRLTLPLRVDAQVHVAAFRYEGRTAVDLRALAGHYRFDGTTHQLDGGQMQLAAGRYQVQGTLQAQAPSALTLRLQGTVPTTVPGSGQPLTLQARASVQGPLAGAQATLAVQAQLSPEPSATTARPATATTTARINAQVQPWQPQPLTRADAVWQALDLAALWPRAPLTRLSGQAQVTPQAVPSASAQPVVGWQAQVQLDNTLPGPWNQQHLPLQHLQLQARYTQGDWTLTALRASGAGGQVQGQAHSPAPAPATTGPALPRVWEGQVQFQSLNPARIDTRLAPAALDGQFSAQLDQARAVDFALRLQPSTHQPAPVRNATAATAAPLLGSLPVRTLRAQGRWSASTLTLQQLQIGSDDAQLQGHGSFNTASHAAEGDLSLHAPGLDVALNGHLSSASGQGSWRVNVGDAARATHWLARWPGVPSPLTDSAVQGQGSLNGEWQGGWDHLGQALKLQATLDVPKLQGGSPPQAAAPTWQIQALHAELGGSLAALRLNLRGQADLAGRHLQLQTQAQAGRSAEGGWQGRIDSARLEAQLGSTPTSGTATTATAAGLWNAQLVQPVTLVWQQSASGAALNLSASQLRLGGPAPGNAQLTWQALNWSRNASGHRQWHSQGEVQGLPLGWLELLGGTPMAQMGVRGDLVFGGPWDVSAGSELHLRATLARTSGDLHLQNDSDRNAPLNAGVREASLHLSADGPTLNASLRWDTTHAGKAQAEFKTQLQAGDGGWTWPANAPLSASVRAQLPRVGVWSVLAPPGWRLRGTLDADAHLSGTRAAPQWHGTLRADDLAVYSVVEGIEFSQGQLRATLDGQRLGIDAFTLKGASAANGASGGQLSAKGFVLWPPADTSGRSALLRLRMELDVQAHNLRLSARADRRLAVSGQLSARLAEAQLVLRGQLQADQALFILPDDTAPRLGADVVIRSASAPASGTAPAPTQPSTNAPVGLHVTPDIAVTLDLGPDFQLRGRGLSTRLTGSVSLRSAASGQPPRISGDIRTVGGTYKAYSQQLDIESGLLRFTGAYDNPSLDVLAIRPNLTQRVGVQITGTVLSPRVRLYADPELADADKLAWLVLGRAAASGGAESAVLQQAALALLGGNGKGLSGTLAEALGLDELSVRGSGTNSDGTATGATVTLGKRLSRNFYVAYERSLAGTLGTFSIFYDLSRRFTLRAQTGEPSAVDLIFTLRYD